MTIIDSIFIHLDVLEGRNLVAKDRKFGIGKKTSSDPYVKIAWNGRTIDQTQVQNKTVNPNWNHTTTIQVPSSEIDNCFMKKGQGQEAAPIMLYIYDWDKATDDDPMGTVTVPITSSSVKENIERKWFPVTTGGEGGVHYCHNATGDVCVNLKMIVHKLMHLKPGNTLPLHKYSQITVGLAWEPELEKLGTTAKIDLDASCVALSTNGQILMDHTVYYGNTSNPNRSIWHSGDETTGESTGDDERIHFHLHQIPNHVAALYLILSVTTPNLSLAQIKSTLIRFYHGKDDLHRLCGLAPAELGDYTSLIVARLARDSNNKEQWNLCPIEVGTSPSRDFGTLVPQIKSYSRDILPNIQVDPNERIAIMRKNGVVRLRDFCRNQSIPKTVSFGLAWDITNGKNIDLDASAICLDETLQKVDLVYFGQLQSQDGTSIQHCGDEREGGEVGDDETINIQLQNVPSHIAYIGIVVNSYSGQELDDVARASCHLYDTETRAEIARYALTDNKPLDKHTALVMGCLYRNAQEEWMLHIISEPAHGSMAQDNVDELQNFLKRNPAPMEPNIMVETEEEEIDLSMPAAIDNSEEEEIVVVPMAEIGDDEEIVIPPSK